MLFNVVTFLALAIFAKIDDVTVSIEMEIEQDGANLGTIGLIWFNF